MLVDAVVDRYYLPVTNALQEESETIKERIVSNGSERVRIERLYQLKRKALTGKDTVGP